MRSPTRNRRGFSLIELLIVVSLIGILAALMIPDSNAGIRDKLVGAAQSVASDLAYGRSLAVTNNSSYRFTFDLSQNRYYLEHSGTNAALNTLPFNPFKSSASTSTRYFFDLDELPSLAGGVTIAAVGSMGSSGQPQTTIEFNPYGQTTSTTQTAVWLTSGSGTAQRYIWISVNPVTGLADVEDFSGSGPPASIVAGS